ncbi:MAG: hypothetical protein K8R56_04410 [Candidatus Eisenbacteria bacterium]|nr:hypothetical protein [Candidatus Eisenbacteria bacterium]
MRRAIALALLLLAFASVFALPRTTSAATIQINGIGLVDYTHKPDFKVGDWVRYRMSSSSELGMSEDYTITLLIGGEQDFWGDPGFWIETWKETPGQPPEVLCSLMSYEIFRDTVATQRLQLYTRAMVNTLNEDGEPRVELNKPAASMLKTRREVKNPVRWTRDTLGVDTVITPKGTFKGLKTILKQGTGSTQAVGDSSVYQELREERTSYVAMEVPITHLAREDIMTIAARKAWLIGRSGDATPLSTRDKGLGTARLLDFGHGGLEPRITPARYRMSIAAQRAAAAAAAKPRTAATRTSTSKAGKP